MASSYHAEEKIFSAAKKAYTSMACKRDQSDHECHLQVSTFRKTADIVLKVISAMSISTNWQNLYFFIFYTHICSKLSTKHPKFISENYP